MGYGGAVALYLEDNSTNFVFAGISLSFKSCSVKYGINVYFNGFDFLFSVILTSFAYDYDRSDKNYLKGVDKHDVSIYSLVSLHQFFYPLAVQLDDDKTTGFDCKSGCHEYLDVYYYLCPKDTIKSKISLNF
jgi:hypothetical protein